MNKTGYSRMTAILSGVLAVLWSCSQVANAYVAFGEPTWIRPPVNDASTIAGASISADGLEIYYDSFETAPGFGLKNIMVATRATTADDWGNATLLGSEINGGNVMELCPRISADGLELYFTSYRSGRSDIYVSRRQSSKAPWQLAENVVALNTSDYDSVGSLSLDGLEIYYYNYNVLKRATRITKDSAWQPAVFPGPTITSGGFSGPGGPSYGGAAISPDGLCLIFASDTLPGGAGNIDLWMSTRATKQAAWGDPVNLGSPMNTSDVERTPWITYDGSTILFESGHPFTSGRTGGIGNGEIWQAAILPVVDFNGDGKVDDKDIPVMQGRWGQADPLCDIGPFPWGDGIVDTQDLMVLMKAITGSDPNVKPLAHAADVPRDVILKWIAPSFAQSYDVYFGTSFADVNSADRANPKGVLVSQGLTATTYDPPGLLDYSRTYWWRVDFVSAGPAPTIYKGAVLDITTEAFAYPIKNVIARASSAWTDSGPEKTVDGSGLDKNGGHSTDPKDMWWSLGVSSNWIQYEFDGIYTLYELWVWNFNQLIEPSVGFGAKSVKIEYSTDGTTWTSLANVPEFARAPGKPGYTANTIVSFGGASAKFVKLTINSTWGGVSPQTGLSEVRFFYIPVASVPKP